LVDKWYHSQEQSAQTQGGREGARLWGAVALIDLWAKKKQLRELGGRPLKSGRKKKSDQGERQIGEKK